MAVRLKLTSPQELSHALGEALASGLTIRPTGAVACSYWVDDPFFPQEGPFLTAIYWGKETGWEADCSCGQPGICLHIALAFDERRKHLENLTISSSVRRNITFMADRLLQNLDLDNQGKGKERYSRPRFCDCGEPLSMIDWSIGTGDKCRDCRESGK